MTRPLLVVAAAALINPEGRILLAQRPDGKPLAGLWEFPGGKLEPGETPEQALQRELKEELGIGVSIDALIPLTFASFSYPSFHLLMPLYGCRRWSGDVRASEGQSLAWAEPARLREYPAPPADVPLFTWLATKDLTGVK